MLLNTDYQILIGYNMLPDSSLCRPIFGRKEKKIKKNVKIFSKKFAKSKIVLTFATRLGNERTQKQVH